jgi:hypothetical protein
MSNEIMPTDGGLLEKGLDIMRDPNASKPAKIGAVGLIAIGAIAVVTVKTIDAMGSK